MRSLQVVITCVLSLNEIASLKLGSLVEDGEDKPAEELTPTQWYHVHKKWAAEGAKIAKDDKIKLLLEQFVKDQANRNQTARILINCDSTCALLSEVLHARKENIKGLEIDFMMNMRCFFWNDADGNENRVRDYLSEHKPNAIVWNLGIHLLHAYPKLSCKGNHSKAFDCGDYKDVVQTSATFLKEHAPDARLIWRTTTTVCDKTLPVLYRGVVRDYKDKKDQMVKECNEKCPHRFSTSARQCQDELMDYRSTKIQRDTSLYALKKLSFGVEVVDAWEITKDRCELEGEMDGIHHGKEMTEAIALNLAELLLRSPP